MRFLLDTHALLWFYLNDPRLSAGAMTLIQEPANVKLVSPASYWEIAIKVNIGKYALKVSYDEFIQEAIHDNGFDILPIEPRNTSAFVALPRHHNDPFDRLLIAQAMVEGASILSVDAISTVTPSPDPGDTSPPTARTCPRSATGDGASKAGRKSMTQEPTN